MSGKRKRDDEDFEFVTPSSKLAKTQKEEAVTRSGRSRKKPARFLDESIEEDIDKIDEESEEEEEPSLSNVKVVKSPPVKQPQPQQKLLLQTLQSDQKALTILAQQKVQPLQIQVPGTNLVQRVVVPQGIRVVSPTSPQIQVVSTAAPQMNVVSQLTPPVKQQAVPQIITQNVVQSPTTPTAAQAGGRGRVRKKSAKLLEMEEFEEAEKTKPKKSAGKQQSPIASPIQQSPIKQPPPPTGITIVKNEQGQNVVLSVAGGIPGVKAEPQPVLAKTTKSKGKAKDQVIENTSLAVKEEPGDITSALSAHLQEPKTSSKKPKTLKSEPPLKIQQGGIVLQESPPSPSKKGKSVIKMLLNTPTQFTPTVSTTAISSDKVKETAKTIEEKTDPVVTSPGKNVKKILVSPGDLDDSHLSDDEDEDDDEFDDELDDDDDEGDDEEDMDWQFENLDGKELSPTEVKKAKKKPSKKKNEEDFEDDDFGDDDEDDDEGNLVIADDVSKKKKTTKKAPSKKKDGGKGGAKSDKPVKEKKKKRLTAYTMWCNSMRTKVLAESPGIDFATLSRRLGEIWQGLPSRDKMSWKRKAKREVRKLLGKGLISTGKTAAPTPTTATVVQQKATPGPKSVPPIHHTPITHKAAVTTQKLEEHAVQFRGSGIEPIDVAAYLKLVGESLSIIGMRLQEHRGLIAVQGSLSVLLDSLLCALGPLMCLTTQIPELHGCPAETHSRTLDNLAYFMPGL